MRDSSLWIPPNPIIQLSGEGKSSKIESSQLEIKDKVETAEQKQWPAAVH